MIRSPVRHDAFVAASVIALCIAAAAPAAACDQWLAPPQMEVIQTNGTRVGFTVIQVGTAIHGFASYQTTKRTVIGNYSGSLVGDIFYARVLWTYSGVSAIGQYRGRVKPMFGVPNPKGYIFEGTTFDEYRQPPSVEYWNAYHFTCADVAAPTPTPAPPPLVTINTRPLGDSITAKRSSGAIEAIKGSRADALAEQGTTETSATADVIRANRPPVSAPKPTPAPAPIDTDAMAERGAELSGRIPLADELRNQQPDESARHGFDIGMGAAEGDTLPGPGKQRTHDSLPPDEQRGFEDALALSLDWNRNTDLARQGAALADGDPDVAQARQAEADPLYTLGFDIAAGLAGSGSTDTGNTNAGADPGSVRSALGDRARRGFDAGMAFFGGR